MREKILSTKRRKDLENYEDESCEIVSKNIKVVVQLSKLDDDWNEITSEKSPETLKNIKKEMEVNHETSLKE